MRLLSRTPPRVADADLTYFSVSEANDFRRLVERSFAAAGREVTVYPDRVEDRSGTSPALEHRRPLRRHQPERLAGAGRRPRASRHDAVTRALGPLAGGGRVGPLPAPRREGVGARPRFTGLRARRRAGAAGGALGRPRLRRDADAGGARRMGDDRQPARARTGESPCAAARSEPRRRDRGGGRARQVHRDHRRLGLHRQPRPPVARDGREHFTDENDWGRGFLVASPTATSHSGGPSTGRTPRSRSTATSRPDSAGSRPAEGRSARTSTGCGTAPRAQGTSYASGKARVLRDTGLRELLKSL